MAELYSNSIFFIEVDKINPNPFQPRREFDERALNDLALSIRQYGVLQPLVVSRVEIPQEDGSMKVSYELIAGERRLRASKIAGLREVPAVIRVGDDPMTKLELAIIENLQREDLNAVERARAFLRLQEEFNFTHTQIGQKMGKSREYVSNTLRLLQLPEEILNALSEGKISEGHTRPLMMLSLRPDEQLVLFKEIVYKKISVREAERIARRIATDKVRKKEYIIDPEIATLENKLRDALGTRVHIEKKSVGGQITIDFFSDEDLNTLLDLIETKKGQINMMAQYEHTQHIPTVENQSEGLSGEESDVLALSDDLVQNTEFLDDRTKEEVQTHDDESEEDLYNIGSFSV